jgi:hypothetical protein
MIHSVKVLNTVTALGTDVSVDSSGILNMAGVATSEVYNLRNVTINTPVAPVNGVITLTPNATASAVVTLTINAFSKATGLPKTMIVNYTAGAATSALLQSAQIRAIVNADSDFTVVATGTSTVVLTSATGFSPEFSVGGTSASLSSMLSPVGVVTASSTTTVLTVTAVTSGALSAGQVLTGSSFAGTITEQLSGTIGGIGTYSISGGAVQASATATGTYPTGVTLFTGVTGSITTQGVIAVGTPAILQNKYGYDPNTNSMTYSDMANLTTGYYYTEVIIDWLGTGYTGSSAFKGEISTNQTVIFVRFDTAATTPSTTNYNDLLGIYGTVTGLQAGYRVSASAITGTAGTNTTNVQTMTSGVLGSEDVVSGDYIVGDAGVAATTTRKVISVLSQTTFLTTTATAITGSTFRVFKWRALPL